MQRCDPCRLKRKKAVRKAAKQRWSAKNPEASRVITSRAQFKHKYGITPEQAQEILKTQGGICAMPDCSNAANRLDHCHRTGVVRGWLCHGCNVRLSGIEDTEFLSAAQRYLSERSEGVLLWAS